MTTPKEYAKLATQIGQTADLLTPREDEEYAQARQTAVYHLRQASRILREISEHKAGKEGTEK